MRTFKPEDLTKKQRHQYLLGTVNPRPICFASTLNQSGQPNLAPYSFFNIFNSTPPILIFSVGNRRDGSLKDTLRNAKDTGEVVINLVNYPMARQMAICGVEYDTGINEFEKGGFTPIPSEIVKPFRVKESPVQFECKVLEIKSFDDKPGAAHLVIAEAVLIHADESIFAPDDTIDPNALDMVGRLGSFNYSRVKGDSIFAIKQPPAEIAIGFDQLPDTLKASKVLTGHHLALLAGVTDIPDSERVEEYKGKAPNANLLASVKQNNDDSLSIIHQKLKEFLESGQTEEAWLFYLATRK
jgi:flavin reductase (DIM6/NTAB) family NADH-FMN oxidoreductase RutF